jgi:dTDP-glucose pyrophosphorylase
MLNIVIPMAGAGSRFAQAGYLDPKPLIPICGIPMIGLVIRNLAPKAPHRFIFVCQQAHLDQYNLAGQLSQWAPGSIIVPINGLTEGAACTVLAARQFIDTSAPLMIANSDQWVDFSIDDYLAAMNVRDLDGYIMTMKANDPKWSFVGLSEEGFVTKVVEKEVISDEATVGIYNFRQGKVFVSAANEMIASDLRVNGEFYVAPAYNVLISRGFQVGVHNIGSESNGMYGLGTPADLDLFLRLPECARACSI